MRGACSKCGGLREPILIETGQTLSGFSDIKLCDCKGNEK